MSVCLEVMKINLSGFNRKLYLGPNKIRTQGFLKEIIFHLTSLLKEDNHLVFYSIMDADST